MLFEGWSVRLLRTTNGGNQTAAGLPGHGANSPLGTNDPLSSLVLILLTPPHKVLSPYIRVTVTFRHSGDLDFTR